MVEKRGLFIGFCIVLIFTSFVSAVVPASVSLGKQKVIVVYAYPSYVNNLPFFDKKAAADLLFGEDSAASYFKEMSFGQAEIVGSDGNPGGVDDFYGPFALEMQAGECTPDTVYKKLGEALKPYHVLEDGLTVAVLLVTENCKGFVGGGEHHSVDFGTQTQPLSVGFAIDFTSSAVAKFDLPTITHELLHSVGLGHAMYFYCLFQEGVSPDDCTSIVEHGDPFDIMGSSNILSESNSVILEAVGWIGNGDQNIITVTPETLPADKTFILKPLADLSPGLKAIKIPHGRIYQGILGEVNTFLYVEYRKPVGPDKKLQDYFTANNKKTNVFQGVLLHTNIFRERYSKLFNPFPLAPEDSGECNRNSIESCARGLMSALPYGKSYTDPNTGTVIRVGSPTAEGLPTTIEKLGRTDFTPPEVGEIKVTDTDDPCIVDLEVNPTDPSGISKVEWYEFAGSAADTSKKLGEASEAPWGMTYDLVKLYPEDGTNRHVWVRVYDNAKTEGGKVENNYKDSPLSIPNKCFSKAPIVIIDSPYLDKPFSSENGERRLKFPRPVRNPVPLKIKMISTDGFFISLYQLDSEDVTSAYGRRINIQTEATLESEGLKEKIVSIALFLEVGKHRLSLTVRSGSGGSGDDTQVFIDIDVLPSIPFIRGDSNNDGKVDISDAINTLNYLYSGTGKADCQDAGDANDDGRVDISDAVYTLNYLFQGNPAKLPVPNSLEESDKTYDTLVC